ncbi:MAG: hypothetical protein V1645_04910 [archaeon]
MVFKATLSGIDGSGKSSALDQLSRRLSHDGYTVAHTLRPFYIDMPKGRRERYAQRYEETMDCLHQVADKLKQKTFIGMINVIHHCGVSKIIEDYAIKKFKPDVVLAGRDTLLDPFAYSAYYFSFTKSLPVWIRKRVDELMNKSRADMTFYMDIDPDLAYERILKRIEKEKKESNELREKWAHMHENPKDLRFLKQEFETAIDLFGKGGQVIVRIDASKPLDDIVEEIFTRVKSNNHLTA